MRSSVQTNTRGRSTVKLQLPLLSANTQPSRKINKNLEFSLRNHVRGRDFRNGKLAVDGRDFQWPAKCNTEIDDMHEKMTQIFIENI